MTNATITNKRPSSSLTLISTTPAKKSMNFNSLQILPTTVATVANPQTSPVNQAKETPTKLHLVNSPPTPTPLPPTPTTHSCLHTGCTLTLTKQPHTSTGSPLTPSQLARRQAILDQDKRTLTCTFCARPCYAGAAGPAPVNYVGVCVPCGGRMDKVAPITYAPFSAQDKALMRSIEGGGWTEGCLRWGCKEHGRRPNGRPFWDQVK